MDQGNKPISGQTGLRPPAGHSKGGVWKLRGGISWGGSYQIISFAGNKVSIFSSPLPFPNNHFQTTRKPETMETINVCKIFNLHNSRQWEACAYPGTDKRTRVKLLALKRLTME